MDGLLQRSRNGNAQINGGSYFNLPTKTPLTTNSSVLVLKLKVNFNFLE
jgi:hypothetical protein